MRDMVMQMTGSNGLLSVPDEHLPGLVVLVLIGPVVWLALSALRALAARQVPWARRAQSRLDAIGFAGRFALSWLPAGCPGPRGHRADALGRRTGDGHLVHR